MSFDTTPLPPYTSSDPTATYCALSAYDLLLIELVPLAERLSLPPPSSSPSTSALPGTTASTNTTTPPAHAHAPSSTNASVAASALGPDADETRELVHQRLDTLGYRVGLGLVERFSRDRPRFTDTLDVIKYLCKELWTLLWRKQVDNLKTNHRGVYVLTDNTFRPMSRMSVEVGKAGADAGLGGRAQPFLYFPCGVIRGVLGGLGVDASVVAETGAGGGGVGGGAVFQVKVTGAKI